MKDKEPQIPSKRDLEKWEIINHDLLDWLYSGVTGKMQIKGHNIIHEWSNYLDNQLCLEIGCGHGHHVQFSKPNKKHYLGLDINFKFLSEFFKRHSNYPLILGDAYKLPFKSNSIPCAISVYNLEHLKHLKNSLIEVQRVLKPDGSFFAAVPAEGGLIYGLGRELTSKPYMEKKYGIDYDAIVKYEHCNSFLEIKKALTIHFEIKKIRYIPFSFLPTYHLNAFVCFNMKNNKLNN